MRTNAFPYAGLTRMVPVAMVALLFVQCTGDGADTPDAARGGLTTEYQSKEDSLRMSRGETRNADGTWSNANTTTTNHHTNRGWTTNESINQYLYPTNRPTPATPAEERALASSDMRGLRAILMSDLELVRERLNDGTRTDAQKDADQSLAAELAQGLERVDRALLAMDATTDKTWNEMRGSHLKEVEEVRTWMVGYREKDQQRG